jgi:hypothetical protein
LVVSASSYNIRDANVGGIADGLCKVYSFEMRYRFTYVSAEANSDEDQELIQPFNCHQVMIVLSAATGHKCWLSIGNLSLSLIADALIACQRRSPMDPSFGPSELVFC